MISRNAVDLIVNAEGLNQPGHWPGGDSGITLGYGYDLGYVHPAPFGRDWGPHLPAAHIDRLAVACLVRGSVARDYAAQYTDVAVTPTAARAVFLERSLPRYEVLTRAAFGRGVELLPPDAFGALVSLVYNRGASMTGERRREMRAIRDACAQLEAAARAAGDAKDAARRACLDVAAQLRAMKRLWVGKGLDGLLARREAEAQLVDVARATLA